MKTLCSLVIATVIGFGAAANAGEAIKLGDDGLDSVTAGGWFASAFTDKVFMIFGSSGSLTEESTSTTSVTDGMFRSWSSASVQITASGSGDVAAGGTAGTFGFNDGGANGN